jgi:uncharacterized protein
MTNPEDVLFSPAVKAEQTRLGSRVLFEDREWKTEITDDLRQFLKVVDTFFLATASADGQPYIQHRGGPPGLLKPIGTNTLAFADFAGNRQYITLGHLKRTTAPTSSSCTSPRDSASSCGAAPASSKPTSN